MNTEARTLRLRTFALLGLVFLLALAWQIRDGAYGSEFGGHPDEAAHCVTGLMVRDYLAAHLPGNPLTYAQSYYEHYPKIGLGVWPPVFYLVQALWTLPFGASHTTLLVLMAALAAGVAVVIYRALRESAGETLAVGAALAWISLPLARELYGMVMAETLSALFMFGAVVVFGRFLETPRTRDGLLFGLLAAGAILTKGTGLALALMALLALLGSREWRLWRHPGVWGGALVTAVLAGPWTWKFRELGHGGWLQPSPSWSFTREALPYYLGKLGLGVGLGVGLFALAGLVFLLRDPVRLKGRWCAVLALLPAILVFQSLAPVGLEARHLVPALPAVLLLAAYGAARLGALAPPRVRYPAVVLFLCAALLPQNHPKHCGGFAPLARYLQEHLQPGEEILVASDASGEGMFISELALRDSHRPGYTVQRASKALAESNWRGGEYRAKFADEAALSAFLHAGQIRYLVLDDSVPPAKRTPHGELLQKLVEHQPASFPHPVTSPIRRGVATGLARIYLVGP